MRRSPHFAMKDPEEVKRLIRRNPWATFVSMTEKGLVASHYPVILDEEASAEPGEIVIVSHFGLPDDRIHELGSGEILVIVQGPHDYVSSSWYPPETLAPTWNHLSAHLHGTPEILSADENFAMLAKLTDHFEQHYPGGRSLFEASAERRISSWPMRLIEETFPLACGAEEHRRFLEKSRPHAAGWVGFYWGQTPEELKESRTIPDAMISMLST